MKRLGRQLFGLVALTLVCACGGGGDGGPIPPADDYNVQAAWNRLLTGTPARTGSGRGSDGHDYSLRLAVVPVAGSTYPVTATPANRADISTQLRIDGAVSGTGTNELYYDDTLRLLGSHDTFSVVTPPTITETCDLATTAGVPPTAAKVNASGPLATTQILQTCASNAAVVGTSTLTWSLEFRADVVYFCINFDELDNASGIRTLEKDCVETDPAGNLGQRAIFALRAPGFAVDMVAP